ncbi:hypothetical protein SAMN02745116_00945, partial [Pilibacter termitis]
MSLAIYLPEAELQVALRTATRLQHFVARHRKAKWGGLKFATVSHAIHLLETKFQVALRTVA